jgi:hypothetical protein
MGNVPQDACLTDLSIVIPAFNEEVKIARDVEAAAGFLAQWPGRGEVIVVDDGSTDRTARVAAEVAVPPGIERRVVVGPVNRGKGFALRTGMRLTRGRYAMFADSGLCIPYATACLGMDLIRAQRCEIAHGSRRLGASVVRIRRPLHRQVVSAVFHTVITHAMGVPRHLTDCSCGFKVYRGDVARTIYGECITDRYAFDLEVVLRAHRRGYRIAEFPIDWSADLDSRLKAASQFAETVCELALIRRTLRRTGGARIEVQDRDVGADQ